MNWGDIADIPIVNIGGTLRSVLAERVKAAHDATSHGINMRRHFGNHRQLYSLEWWIATRPRRHRTAAFIREGVLYYRVIRWANGRNYEQTMARPLVMLARYRDGWRSALACDIRAARQAMRRHMMRDACREIGIVNPYDVETANRLRAESERWRYGAPMLSDMPDAVHFVP